MVDTLPQIFKGIALITPGGDLIYGIDLNKQAQWHVHLCHSLHEIFDLAAAPHFLVPGYTATVERWLDPTTNQLETIAEVYPAAQKYIPLLQILFGLETNTKWQVAPWQEEYCARAAIETYRTRFPQLWQHHNLITRLDPKTSSMPNTVKKIGNSQVEGYNLRLFISSDRASAEKTLNNIHHLLESGLSNPYTLKVIDVAKNPEQAAIHRVITTPTLIRISPEPIKRIVGQLDDIPRVLSIISSL